MVHVLKLSLKLFFGFCIWFGVGVEEFESRVSMNGSAGSECRVCGWRCRRAAGACAGAGAGAGAGLLSLLLLLLLLLLLVEPRLPKYPL